MSLPRTSSRAASSPSRPALWLLVTALLLGALAPAVSRALAGTRSGVGADICSSQSSPLTRGSGALAQVSEVIPAGGSAPSASALDYCPLCLLAAYPMAPPPAERERVVISGADARFPLPALLRHAQREPSSVRARGPPGVTPPGA